MFNPFRSAPDADGFTKKDKRIYEIYEHFLQKGTASGDLVAIYFLDKVGWTEDCANNVKEHFFPKRIYTEAEIAAAREAVSIYIAGDKKAARALHNAHGLSLVDVSGCLEQRAAEPATADNA
jgi:hypothetical protein